MNNSALEQIPVISAGEKRNLYRPVAKDKKDFIKIVNMFILGIKIWNND